MSQPGDSIVAELETRQGQRDKLAELFKAHPMDVLFPSDFEPLVGPNYRSRISDCRDDLGMQIDNVPQFRDYELAVVDSRNGSTRIVKRRQRLIGGYRYVPRPEAPLGRDAGEQVSQKSLF